MKILMNVLELSASICECVMITYFITKILGFKKNEYRATKFLLLTFASIIDCLFLEKIIPASIAETVPGLLEMIICIVFSCIFLNGAVFFKCYVAFLSNYLLFLINTPVLMIASHIGNSSNLGAMIYSEETIRISILISTKLLYFIATKALIIFYEKQKRTTDYRLTNPSWFILLFICAAFFMAGLAVFQKSVQTYNPFIMLVASIIAFACIALTYFILYMAGVNKKEKGYLQLQQNMNDMLQRKFHNFKDSTNRLFSLNHDTKNNYAALLSILENGEIEKAEEKLKYLLNAYSEKDVKEVHISNAAVRSIVKMKLTDCKNKGIEFSCNEFNENIDIDELDLCNVLGNLLNNAIEACENIENSNIKLSLIKNKKLLLISVTNSLETSVINENKNLKTTKSDKKFHGYGIKNIRDIASKYNGKTEFTEENGQFVARVWLMA